MGRMESVRGNLENRIAQAAFLPHSIAKNAIEWAPTVVWATRLPSKGGPASGVKPKKPE
jgi:hypothetical protein